VQEELDSMAYLEDADNVEILMKEHMNKIKLMR